MGAKKVVGLNEEEVAKIKSATLAEITERRSLEEAAPDEAREAAQAIRAIVSDRLQRLGHSAADQEAMEDLRRLRRAAYRVQTEYELPARRLVRPLAEMHNMRRRTRGDGKDQVQALREWGDPFVRRAFADWSDKDLLTVLRAVNFSVVCSRVFLKHGYGPDMSRKNIESILKKARAVETPHRPKKARGTPHSV